MAIKLAVVGLSTGGQGIVLICLVIDGMAYALLLQGAFFGTRITHGGYGHR